MNSQKKYKGQKVEGKGWEMIEDFKKGRSLLKERIPELVNHGFYFQQFFFSERRGMKRFGAFYSSSQFSPPNESFIYLIETFPEEKLEDVNLSGKGESMGDTEVFYDYTPDFQLVKNFIQRIGKRISWRKVDEIHSIVLNKDQPREKLEEYYKLIKRSTSGGGADLELFDLLKYLPVGSEGWNLQTVLMWHQVVVVKQERHWIRHLQGNYRLEGEEKYLNLELRFGCENPQIKEDLKKIPNSSSLESEEEMELDGKKFVLKSIKNFKNQSEVEALFWFDEDNSCTLIVHNNRTTDFEEHKEGMENLAREGLNSLEDYSVIERIAERKLPDSLTT